jgi:hypothetical protein
MPQLHQGALLPCPHLTNAARLSAGSDLSRKWRMLLLPNSLALAHSCSRQDQDRPTRGVACTVSGEAVLVYFSQ